MVIGKITPALIDPAFLKEISKTKPITEIIIKSPLVEEIDYICAKFITFVRIYWMYITVIVGALGYLYYCHIKYKKEKTQTDNFNPGEYVKVNNGVQILQRPIPEAQPDSINKEIRNMYLDDVESLNCSVKPIITNPHNGRMIYKDDYAGDYGNRSNGYSNGYINKYTNGYADRPGLYNDDDQMYNDDQMYQDDQSCYEDNF